MQYRFTFNKSNHALLVLLFLLQSLFFLLFKQEILALIEDDNHELDSEVIEAFGKLIKDSNIDHSMKALAMSMNAAGMPPLGPDRANKVEGETPLTKTDEPVPSTMTFTSMGCSTPFRRAIKRAPETDPIK